MKLKVTVQNKEIQESLIQSYYKQEHKVDGYVLGLLLDLEGSVKREYHLFTVDKTTFEKYNMGDTFNLEDLAKVEPAPQS